MAKASKIRRVSKNEPLLLLIMLFLAANIAAATVVVVVIIIMKTFQLPFCFGRDATTYENGWVEMRICGASCTKFTDGKMKPNKKQRLNSFNVRFRDYCCYNFGLSFISHCFRSRLKIPTIFCRMNRREFHLFALVGRQNERKRNNSNTIKTSHHLSKNKENVLIAIFAVSNAVRFVFIQREFSFIQLCICANLRLCFGQTRENLYARECRQFSTEQRYR